LIEAGAVGDVLYNFIDNRGDLVKHDVNDRVISVNLSHLRRTPERVLISGGKDKMVALNAAITTLAPTTLITDEQTAAGLSRHV
jgi:deoxyribonucleoside regulator